jgi:hypothetical protein
VPPPQLYVYARCTDQKYRLMTPIARANYIWHQVERSEDTSRPLLSTQTDRTCAHDKGARCVENETLIIKPFAGMQSRTTPLFEELGYFHSFMRKKKLPSGARRKSDGSANNVYLHAQEWTSRFIHHDPWHQVTESQWV